MPISTFYILKLGSTVLYLSDFELYSRWLPLKKKKQNKTKNKKKTTTKKQQQQQQQKKNTRTHT